MNKLLCHFNSKDWFTLKSGESYLNVLGWILLFWQLPFIWIGIRLPFRIRYIISATKRWFCNWYKDKHWLYPREIRENLKDPYGLIRRMRYEIDSRKEKLKIVPMTNKERSELIAREKKKMQSSYQKMCNVTYCNDARTEKNSS